MPKELLDTITAIGAIATPVLLALLAGLGWLLKQSFERSQLRQLNQAARVRELEDKLREDRIETYNALLEPFFLLFTSEAAYSQDPKYKGKKKDEMAISRMLSVEYRKIGFKLSLVASDEVVRAYNALMQFFYHDDGDASAVLVKTSVWVKLLADLLLKVRRSMGNEATTLELLGDDRMVHERCFGDEAPVVQLRSVLTRADVQNLTSRAFGRRQCRTLSGRNPDSREAADSLIRVLSPRARMPVPGPRG